MKKNAHKKVLVIDDEESILDTIQIILEMEGYQVESFSTPPSVEQILEKKPHIILIDLLLKGTDGKRICKRLKNDDRAKYIPVILLSAHTEQMLQDAIKECGADGHLAKPFDMNALIALVNKLAL